MPYGRKRYNRRRVSRRFNKRRFPARTSSKFRKGFKRRVLSALHNRPRPELKFSQIAAIATPTPAGTPNITFFTGLAQGISTSQRIGGRLELKKLSIRFIHYTEEDTVTPENNYIDHVIRVVIVRLKTRASSSAVPTLTTMYDSSTEVAVSMPWIKTAVQSRATLFKILYDRQWRLNHQNGPQSKAGMIRLKLRNRKVQYEGTASSDNNYGSIVMYVWSSTVGLTSMEYLSRLRYSDV